ncbi:hypothetical protein GCM10025865_29180 [Paraoerskovia sediminicola]|uniref:Uncharacterized protein n=1 Tax=Paraoerskovia sediminicola TaxID=1138587 RepID=A0ABM8G666_9CELL|nr:hypothetical protein [Paraoerskovia sediminicola]BDZ43619.1 hypothetical protein GCM10025865_29180 [Paraoerskovia sediminicola]
MWWIIWVVLVVAAGVVLFVLLRDVWRRAKAVGSELARAQSVASQLSARAAELQALADASPAIRPVDLEDVDAARAAADARRAEDRIRKAESRARREVRDAAVRDRWMRDGI